MSPPSNRIGHLGSETLASGKGSNFSRFCVSKAYTDLACSSHRHACNSRALDSEERLYSENDVRITLLETRRCYIQEWDALEILSLIPAPNRLVLWLSEFRHQTSPSTVALLGSPLGCVLVLRDVQAGPICSACCAPAAEHLAHFFHLIGCLPHRTGLLADLIQVLLHLWRRVFPFEYYVSEITLTYVFELISGHFPKIALLRSGRRYLEGNLPITTVCIMKI